MANQTDQLLLEILGSTKNLESSLQRAERRVDGFSKQTSKSFSSIGAALRPLGPLIAGAFGISALKKFIETASRAEEVSAKFDAVFKSLAAENRKWVEETAQALGRSEIALTSYLAKLQDTFVPLGFARDKSAEFSKTLAQLAIDLASFNNESEPETVDLLTSAIVGNHEAVRRFGIIITESTLKQELMNMGIEKGVRAATDAQKVQARMNIILKSTSDAQGDAARTAGSTANQMRGLGADAEMLAKEYGDLLNPAVRLFIELARGLISTIGEASDATQAFTLAIGAVGVALIAGGPVIAGLTALAAIALVIVTHFRNAREAMEAFEKSQSEMADRFAAVNATYEEFLALLDKYEPKSKEQAQRMQVQVDAIVNLKNELDSLNKLRERMKEGALFEPGELPEGIGSLEDLNALIARREAAFRDHFRQLQETAGEATAAEVSLMGDVEVRAKTHYEFLEKLKEEAAKKDEERRKKLQEYIITEMKMVESAEERKQAVSKETLDVLNAGYNQFWSTLANQSLTGAERWEAIQNAMLQSALRMIGETLWAHLTGEAAKQAATATTAGVTQASNTTQQQSNLLTAASSILVAIAEAIRQLITTLGPFGLLAAGGAVAALKAIYDNNKAALGFDRGGRLTPAMGPGFFEARRPEIVAPEEDFLTVFRGIRNDLLRPAAIQQAINGGSTTNNNQRTVNVAIYVPPGANAGQVRDQVRQLYPEIQKVVERGDKLR